MGLPSLLIAAGWIGLWFLWPSGALPARNDRKQGGNASVRYMRIDYSREHLYKDPTVMSLPFRYGFVRDTAESRTVVEPAGLQRITEPLYLEDSGAHGGGISDGMWVIKPGKTQFKCSFDSSDVFEQQVSSEMRLSVSVSENLERRGFTFPSDDFDEIGGKREWSAEAVVEIDSAGRVEHVFLDGGLNANGSGAKLIRFLRRAYVKKPGPEVSGRVIVNYGSK